MTEPRAKSTLHVRLTQWAAHTPRGALDYAGTQARRWIHGARYREGEAFDYARLRWYHKETATYRTVARGVLPIGLRPLADVSVTGLDNLPCMGAVILAANHYDN